MKNQYSKQFKEDAVNYVLTHSDLTIAECASNLGVKPSTLHTWLHKKRQGEEFRGQGNYSSDLEKENARLRKELKDAQDAIKVLKKTLKIVNE